MKVYNDISIYEFDFWSGAKTNFAIIEYYDKVEELERLIEIVFPEGCSETELNDFVWFDDDFIFEELNITKEEVNEYLRNN